MSAKREPPAVTVWILVGKTENNSSLLDLLVFAKLSFQSLSHPCRLSLTPCLSKASRMVLWLQNPASPSSITWTSSCFLPWWPPSPRYQSLHTPYKSSCLVTITNTFSYTFLKHLIIHSSLDTHGSANITPKLTGKRTPSWDRVCLVTSFVSSLLLLQELRPCQKTARAAWPFCGAFAYHILHRYSSKTVSSPHRLYNYAIDFFFPGTPLLTSRLVFSNLKLPNLKLCITSSLTLSVYHPLSLGQGLPLK